MPGIGYRLLVLALSTHCRGTEYETLETLITKSGSQLCMSVSMDYNNAPPFCIKTKDLPRQASQ